jgi:hypothetical protein
MNKRAIILFLLIFSWSVFQNFCFSQEITKYERAFSGIASLAGRMLGDEWSKRKSEEVAAWEVFKIYEYEYEQVSWLNPFDKLQKYSKYKSARKIYLNRFEARMDYEKTMENKKGKSNISDLMGIFNDLSEKIFDIGTLFGSKKAETRNNLIKKNREYEQALYEYEKSNFFSKWGKSKDLKSKKKAYELALDEYEKAWGSSSLGTGTDLFLKKSKQLAIIDIIEENAKEKTKREFKEKIDKIFRRNSDDPKDKNKDFEQAGNMAKDIFNVISEKKDDIQSSEPGLDKSLNDKSLNDKSLNDKIVFLKSQLDQANSQYLEYINSNQHDKAREYHQQFVLPLMKKMDSMIEK